MPIMWQPDQMDIFQQRQQTSDEKYMRRQDFNTQQFLTVAGGKNWAPIYVCPAKIKVHWHIILTKSVIWELPFLGFLHKFPPKVVSGRGSKLDNIDCFTEGWVGASKKIEDRYGGTDQHFQAFDFLLIFKNLTILHLLATFGTL